MSVFDTEQNCDAQHPHDANTIGFLHRLNLLAGFMGAKPPFIVGKAMMPMVVYQCTYCKTIFINPEFAYISSLTEKLVDAKK